MNSAILQRFALVAAVLAFAACTLNPQPLPPGPDTNPEAPEPGGVLDSADPSRGADSGGGEFADSGNMGAGMDAGDGSPPPAPPDAAVDAPDDAPRDAPRDAVRDAPADARDR